MSTLIIGHRGYKAKYTENTLESFLEALKAGADGIELDVHLTKDGEVVVFHDFELARMTKESGYIFEFALADLKEIKLENHHSIPTLREVLEDLVQYKENFSRSKIMLNVELKAGSQMYPGIEEKVMTLCYENLDYDEVIFSSFDHKCLVKIKTIDNKAQVGVLTTAALVDPWLYVNRIKGDYYHPHYLSLSENNLKEMIENKLLINTYTLNDLTLGKQLMKSGIHMIITDEVEKMLDLRKEVDDEA
jgi:glycerophosphoryl diester phosphodiesterase